MRYLKPIITIALPLCLCPALFAISLTEHEGSVKAHKKLTAKVFEMLRDGKYTQAKKFLESIPLCPSGTIKKSQIPDYCAGEKLGSSLGQWHWRPNSVDVESDTEPGFVHTGYELDTVYPDVILHDAMRTHYRYLAGNNPDEPGAFDKKKSVQLYNTYKDNAWLEPLVKNLVLMWPKAGKQYTTNQSRKGAELYDQVALVQALNFDINVVNRMKNYTVSCDSISETKQLLEAVDHRAKEAQDNKPANAIKRKIFEDILNPKQYEAYIHYGDCKSVSLAKYMSALGSENEGQAKQAWKVLAAKPFTQTMKKNAPELYQFCLANKNGYSAGKFGPKIDMEKIWCDNFAKNAKKYGLMEPKMNEADIRNTIRGHIRSDASGNIWPSK